MFFLHKLLEITSHTLHNAYLALVEVNTRANLIVWDVLYIMVCSNIH